MKALRRPLPDMTGGYNQKKDESRQLKLDLKV